jgi:hypothetical protein
VGWMPVLVLAARLCPPGIEATLFALLMSVTNMAGLVSHESGALLTHWLGVNETNFDQLWLLVIITNLSTLLPLVLVGWLPSELETPNPMPPATVLPAGIEQPVGINTSPTLSPARLRELVMVSFSRSGASHEDAIDPDPSEVP